MAASAVNYTVSVLKEETEFRSLEHEWESLLEHSVNQHFFHKFFWKWHSWRCVSASSGQALRIVTGRSDSKLVLVLPLVISGGVARFLNSGTFEYRDLMIDEEAFDDRWLEPTWQALLDLGEINILLLQNVRSPSSLERLLSADRSHKWVFRDRSPVIRVGEYASWEAYATTRSKKLIADQRRQWRRLAKAAPELKCIVMQDLDEIILSLEWMIEKKENWVQDKNLAHMPWRGDLKCFITQVVRDAHEAGNLLAIKLALGEEIISAGVGFISNKKFSFEIFSYSREWENFSPSRLLQEKFIRWCIANDIDEFDFLPGGGSLYKHLWATDYVPCESYLLEITLRGKVLVRMKRWIAGRPKDLGLSFARCLPKRLRSALHALVAQMPSTDVIIKMTKD